jgi:hypothetical protein
MHCFSHSQQVLLPLQNLLRPLLLLLLLLPLLLPLPLPLLLLLQPAWCLLTSLWLSCRRLHGATTVGWP